MITYEIPLKTFADTYNKKPLMYCALAAQKRHNAVYLMNIYSEPGLEAKLKKGFKAAGKKLDMGKCCIRFKKIDDLPLELIGHIVGLTSVQQFIDIHNACHKRNK